MSRNSESSNGLEVFYSYAHKDEELRDELVKHLAILKHNRVIANWHDRMIVAGEEWEGKIDEHLNTARIILLLVSSDFMASNYCYKIEVSRALERHDAGEACVIPVILRPVAWRDAPFGKLQALPKDAKPITSWKNRDDAFLSVTEGIKSAAQRLASEPAPGSKKVFLSYRRNSKMDEEVLKLLEMQLRENNFEVFIDRHLKVGIEWAREIERNIRDADAVIPLLSSDSVKSEMLAYEVETAFQIAQQAGGLPRLLPVRINYEGPLPDPLSRILGHLQYALWRGPHDDRSLVEQLTTSLRNPPRQFAFPAEPGGAVPLKADYYIIRDTDKEFCDAIAREDFIVLVKGARQMGKTSLLARGLQKANEQQAKVLFTDLQMLNESQMESIETFYKGLCAMITAKLKLNVYLEDVWKPRDSPNINFLNYMQQQVLDKIKGRLVWGIDEVDRLFSRKYGTEVFGMFRAWFNDCQIDPTEWSKLTLAISYATEPHLFITDANQSPFNVGTRMELQDFTKEQVAEFNRRYSPPPLVSEQEITLFHKLLNGHPYLTHRGLHEMATWPIAQPMKFDKFNAQADKDEGCFGDHLRRILVLLARDESLRKAVVEVLDGKKCPTSDSFYRLRSGGVLSGDSWQTPSLRCELYGKYLERHLPSGGGE